MKRFVVSLAAAGLSAGLSAAAFAADISPAPVYTKVPPFTWTGAYFGINGGYGFQTDVNAIDLTSPTATASGLSDKGGLIGVQLGYNYQMGMLVLGIEFDAESSNIKSSSTASLGGGDSLVASSNFGEFLTGRARIGVAFDHLLLYGTGGAALGNVSNNFTVNFAGAGSPQSVLQNDSTELGYVVGAGLEYAIDRSWTVKAEYQYINLGSYTMSGPETVSGLPTGATTTSNSINNDIQTLRFGVNYRFYQ